MKLAAAEGDHAISTSRLDPDVIGAVPDDLIGPH
jgi:hypothetical protein